MIYHNSFLTEYRNPFGALEVNSELTLKVFADYASDVTLRCWTDEHGEQLYDMHRYSDDMFSITIPMPSYGTLVWYYFIVHYPGGEQCMYGAQPDGIGGEGKEYQWDPHSFQITVYKKSNEPSWFKNGIMYQIFPDRFYRGSDFDERAKSNNRLISDDWFKVPAYKKNDAGDVIEWEFYGGTLKGIEEKLPYLSNLGISCIYLNPIFAAKSNHRYDTADYSKIDPLLGDEESFISLCNSAEKLGIHIILDGVFSHTGKDSIYFEEGSPYKDWYTLNEDGSYKCWWGVKDLPEVDETNPSYIEYICGENGIISKWLKLGASGFRLDVADELPDSFIKCLRERINQTKPDALLIGEVWEDASNKFSHGERRKYLMGDELHGVMNYPLRSILIDFVQGKNSPYETLRLINGLIENYPKQSISNAMNLLSSHDRIRLMTILSGNIEQFKMLYTLCFCLPGVPCIYYGDETGMTGNADPQNRAAYPWGKEDNELITFFRNLINDYKNNTALSNGILIPLNINEKILSFIRQDEQQSILVLSNRNAQKYEIYYKGIKYEVPANRTIYTII